MTLKLSLRTRPIRVGGGAVPTVKPKQENKTFKKAKDVHCGWNLWGGGGRYTEHRAGKRCSCHIMKALLTSPSKHFLFYLRSVSQLSTIVDQYQLPENQKTKSVTCCISKYSRDRMCILRQATGENLLDHDWFSTSSIYLDVPKAFWLIRIITPNHI